jgi:penicillin-binding protein 1A
VHTAEQTYQGTINIARATVISDNTVFAQLAADIGFDRLDQTAHAMGITSPLDGYPSEVIGGLRVGVTPLEMADAYGTLATEGIHTPATILGKIVFPDGSVVHLGNPPHNRVFTDGEAYAGINVLKGVITSGTGTAAEYGCPAAGKTGTANNYENAWFVGFTPKLATAVWVGYPQGNIPMANGFGGTLAAPIWHDYMVAASGGYCGDFPPPQDPWTGQAFFGPHATTNKPAPKTTKSGSSSTSSSTSSSSTGSHTTTTGTTTTSGPPLPTGGGGTGPKKKKK